MADFTEGQGVGTVQASGISPARGSGDGTGAGVAIALNTAADMVSIFGRQQMAGQAARVKQEAAKQSGGLVASYTNQLSKLADQVQSGNMTSSEGKARTRALFSQYLSANPAYNKELMAAHKDYLGTPGLGQVIDEGNIREQNVIAAQQEAFKAGFGHDPEKYFEMKRKGEEMAFAQSQVNLTNSQIEQGTKLSQAERAHLELAKARAELEQDQAAGAFIRSGADGLMSRARALDSTGSNRVVELEQMRAETLDMVTADMSYVSSERIAQAEASINRIIDLEVKIATGEIDVKVGENERTKQELALQSWMMQESPTLAVLDMLGNVMGPQPVQMMVAGNPPLFNQVTVEALDYFSKHGQGPATEPGAQPRVDASDVPDPSRIMYSDGNTPEAEKKNKALDQTLGILKANLAEYSTLNEAEKQTVTTTVNGLLKTATQIPVAPGRLKAYKGLSDMMSNNGQYWVENFDKHADVMPEIQAQIAAMGRNVKALVRKEWDSISGLSVDYVGRGISFSHQGVTGDRPEPGYKRTYPGMSYEERQAEYLRRFPDRNPALDAELMRDTRRMNDMAKPLINDLIRAVAHTQGNQDYAAAWENVVKPMLFDKTEAGAVTNAVTEVDGADFDWSEIDGSF